MQVRLTNQEMMTAALIGIMRQVSSLRREDGHGFDGEDGWTIHIEGACGEMATAKALGRYFEPTLNTFKAPDLGANIQVRTRSKNHYDLLIRNDDNLDNIFVLVTGRAPLFEVRGYLRGHDAIKDEWVKTYGGRPAAWFVPQAALLPIVDLVKTEGV
jgi:hypothetical protein